MSFLSLIPCVGIAARETAQALKTLAQAARGVAASTTDPKAAAAMLDSARDVMEGSALLIHEAKQALISPGDAESQQRLAQVRWFRIAGGGVWSLFCMCVLFNTTGDSSCCALEGSAHLSVSHSTSCHKADTIKCHCKDSSAEFCRLSKIH